MIGIFFHKWSFIKNHTNTTVHVGNLTLSCFDIKAVNVDPDQPTSAGSCSLLIKLFAATPLAFG